METKTVDLGPAELLEAAEVAKQIQSLRERLASILGGNVNVTGVSGPSPAPAKRKMPKAAREKIREAALQRWAKVREGKGTGKRNNAPAAQTTQEAAAPQEPASQASQAVAA